MHFLSRVLGFTLLFFLSNGQAEEYYFTAYMSGALNKKFPSAMAACEAMISRCDAALGNSRRATGVSNINYEQIDRFSCSFKTEERAGYKGDGYNWIPAPDVKSCGLNGVGIVSKEGESCFFGKNYNPTSFICSNDEQMGYSGTCPSSFSGNPINFAIGNKFQSETDYLIGGGSGMDFIRSYNSLDGIWRHGFSTYLRFAGTQYVSVVMHDGREFFFTVSGSVIMPISANLGVLSKTSKGWKFISIDNEQILFDNSGRMVQRSGIRDVLQKLSYSGNQVTVTDNLGNSLSFTEDSYHQPLSLTAPGVQITYGYSASKRLASMTRVTGNKTTVRKYHYENPRNSSWLTGITDERGVRYATWKYDNVGRAISSEHADSNEKVTIAYNADGTVSVTNELGKVSTYSFQYIRGINRITSIKGEPSENCPNSNSTFTYDSSGLMRARTDNKGHVTTYSYNTRGLEISRTEASGTLQASTITTEWHPTLFLPTAIIEPDRIIHYRYDDQGRQLSQTVEAR